MDTVIKWLNRASKNVAKMNIKGLPRFFLLSYAFLFLAFGYIYFMGVITETFHLWGIKVNYEAIRGAFKDMFGMATASTFGIIGAALVDADHDGVPDPWERKDGADSGNGAGKKILPPIPPGKPGGMEQQP